MDDNMWTYNIRFLKFDGWRAIVIGIVELSAHLACYFLANNFTTEWNGSMWITITLFSSVTTFEVRIDNVHRHLPMTFVLGLSLSAKSPTFTVLWTIPRACCIQRNTFDTIKWERRNVFTKLRETKCDCSLLFMCDFDLQSTARTRCSYRQNSKIRFEYRRRCSI